MIYFLLLPFVISVQLRPIRCMTLGFGAPSLVETCAERSETGRKRICCDSGAGCKNSTTQYLPRQRGQQGNKNRVRLCRGDFLQMSFKRPAMQQKQLRRPQTLTHLFISFYELHQKMDVKV